MKKTLAVTLASLLVLLTAVSPASACSWRINNNTNRNAHFTDINAACASDDVQDGDTLYLDPGCSLTTAQTVTKRLTIIGTGYFFTDQPYSAASLTSNASLNLNAAGTKVTGLNSTNNICICADNVTIERCKAAMITWNAQGQNAVIRQCYITNLISGNGKNHKNSAYCTIENSIILRGGDRAVANLYSPTIRNNYIRTRYIYNDPVMSAITNGTITNNIIMNTYSASFHNNLFNDLAGCQVTNNLLSCDEGTYAEYPENVCLGTHDESAVFTCTGANDRYYELSEDSPAKDIEAGPFYGPYPYVFSGLPVGVPYYTASSASSMAHDGKITVKNSVRIQTK